MKKFLVFLMVLAALSGVLYAQATITLSAVGIKSLGTDPVTPGNTVEVRLRYSVSGFNEAEGIVSGTAASNAELSKVRVYWYTGTDGTGAPVSPAPLYTSVATGTFQRQPLNDTTYEDVVTFTLPTPASGMNSFKIRTMLYGDDGDMNVVYSSGVYSTATIANYYAYLQINTNVVPVASAVAISNPSHAKVGQTLNGAYTYSDLDSDPESGTQFRWLSSPTLNGTYSAISGATSQTYLVQDTDADSYIKFEVTPYSSTGTSPGLAVLSSAVGPVTEAAFAEIDPTPLNLTENSANLGALDNVYVRVLLTNASYKTGTISGLTMNGLPAGMSVGTINRISASEIRVSFAGSATAHEYNASVLFPNTITVTIPSSQVIGVANNLTTNNGFYMTFNNNAPTNLAVNEVGHNWVKIGWDAPAGVLNSGTGLMYYKVWRNGSYLTQVNHVPGKSTFSYTDTGLATGTANTYQVQAVYTGGGDPYTGNISATPLGFTAFGISNPAVTGTINQETKNIDLILPAGTNLSSLIATFTATNATVMIGGTAQVSGNTANNFSSTLTYTLTSTDNSTTSYTVNAYVVLATPTVIETGLNPTTSGFTARWNAVAGAEGYQLDVSTVSNFASFVTGYENLALGDVTSHSVTGLDPETNYFYRVRATDTNPLLNSGNSTTVSISTTATENITINPDGTITGGTISPGGAVPEALLGSDTSVPAVVYTVTSTGVKDVTVYKTASFTGDWYCWISTGAGLLTGPNPIPAATASHTFSGVDFDAKGDVVVIINDNSTLPVVFSSFIATIMAQGKVRLDWVTQSETGMIGFHVLRSNLGDTTNAIVISPLIEATNTSTTASYSFLDDTITDDGTYYYWLQSADFDGVTSEYGPLTVLVELGDNPNVVIPVVTQLLNPYPNPFNPELSIRYGLAQAANVTISVYNAKGQFVRTLVSKQQPANTYTLVWDGKDSMGNQVSSGTYIIRMNAGSYSGITKAVMIK